MGPVARNLAQLVFLAYSAWLIVRAQRVLRSFLLIRVSEQDLEKNTRGAANKFGFLRLKNQLPPLFYWLNLTAVCAFAADLLFHLILGWFGFFGLAGKIFNSVAVILCGAEAYLMALIDSTLRNDTPFVLYNWDPDGDKIFTSGILDILLCVAGPIAIVVSNFLAL